MPSGRTAAVEHPDFPAGPGQRCGAKQSIRRLLPPQGACWEANTCAPGAVLAACSAGQRELWWAMRQGEVTELCGGCPCAGQRPAQAPAVQCRKRRKLSRGRASAPPRRQRHQRQVGPHLRARTLPGRSPVPRWAAQRGARCAGASSPGRRSKGPRGGKPFTTRQI